MNDAEFELRGVGDPRLAVHATSAFPAWLWSTDGARILWANPVGARLFGAANGAELAKKNIGPADQHRRQVAQLAHRLPASPAVRLERLRGFGAGLGGLITCGCAKLDFADGGCGILIVAAEPAGQTMPLIERLRSLIEGIDTPIAAFARDGMFVGASEPARSLLGFRNLSEAGLEDARSRALTQGRSETPIGIGHMVLQRVGSGVDIGLVALIAPGPTLPDQTAQQMVAPPADLPIADEERPAISGEAPAEFALIDEFADKPTEPPAGHVAPEPPTELEPPPALLQDTAESESSRHEAVVDTAFVESEINHDEHPSQFETANDTAAAPVESSAPACSDAAAAQNITAAFFLDEPSSEPRRYPLRFMWQMDVDGRFLLGSDEFTRLIGACTAASFGRLWSEIAEVFGLDPDNRVAQAIATRHTWSGITVNWPIDGGDRLPVELSGLPIYDRMRNFAGYRGFGVCRDLEGLTRLDALRRREFFHEAASPSAASAVDHGKQAPAADPIAVPDAAGPDAAPAPASETAAPVTLETPHPSDLETPVEKPQDISEHDVPKNVLPFRPVNELRLPALTPVENSAFNELARQLSARLEGENGTEIPPASDASGAAAGPSASETSPANSEQPNWLVQPDPPPRGETLRDKALLDLLPAGVLIYRLDRLVYANPAFLERIGYASLHELEQAGGLDALYVEPGVSTASSTSDTGTPVTICAAPSSAEHAAPSTQARLHTISWDGESALALIFTNSPAPNNDASSETVAVTEALSSPEPSPVGHANAEELGAILDTTAEGIVMFDAEGNINSCNRSAEALFGYDGAELVQRNLAELFAPESQTAVRDYLEAIKGTGVASLLDHGRDVLGCVRGGGLIPLSMTMGRTRHDGPNFFAVFRDLSQAKKTESELWEARRLADRAASAKADMLARISHEVRTPLNAIIGFAEVMIDERFGALGNERYVEYMKDIRASGERVIAIVNDLLDLSRIETGQIDLAFANQNLNDLVESCVAVMQPQANRERIIIRTSLAHQLPSVTADARALRQIVLNLIGNSIHLASAGGQVIVSTALSDFGEVVFRVRDTGHGLNDNEVAAAMEPFRTQAPSDQASDGSGVSLSLTKALVEANRAQFHIKTAARSGTLIEIVFSQALARA